MADHEPAKAASTPPGPAALLERMMLQGAMLMIAGFWGRLALPRWLGLALLVAMVLKAFVYHMRNLGTAYRGVNYPGLDVVLMAVSFAYQNDWLSLKETGDFETHSQGATR